MMAALILKVLGGFELQTAAGRPLVLPTKKALALLAYLALHPERPCSRETLTARVQPRRLRASDAPLTGHIEEGL
jgi:DNA-binding winged helix-turn-helix (wHTH) protein